jgi:hypothetical protein
MAIVQCNINRATERVFKEMDNFRNNLLNDTTFDGFFEITTDPKTSSEIRNLIVQKKDGTFSRTFLLNTDGGLKPTANITQAFTPLGKPQKTTFNFPVETTRERVMHSGVNLVNDPTASIIFSIVSNDPEFNNDIQRNLAFVTTDQLNGLALRLNNNGGKKPLGGPVSFKTKKARKPVK